ncbi:hypothetical protein BJX96DRAFT_178569 [Aspergillus floccosus]
MNRFLKSKKEKVKDDGEAAESFHSTLTAKLSKRSKKEPEEKPELDLSSALPSTDDFRTSLLMPKLSARFSMLREQDDPDTMIGKASDDSVLFPKRASRLNLFGHTPNFLTDIDEVSTDGSRPSFGLGRTDSFASGGDGYGTDDDRSQKDSIMSRARRAEGNNLFGGRQKVYKIPAKATQPEAGRAGLAGRAVYEPDVTLSAFQRYRLQEKERGPNTVDDAQQDANAQESEDGLSSVSSTKRTTFSSTTSGPTANGRTSTAATSIDEQSFSNTSGSLAEGPQTGSKPPLPGMAPDRGSVKSRRLYGQGLAQSVQNQHNSALHRLESLSRQRAGTPELPVLNRSYSRSATNLRDRLQKLAIAEPTGQTSQPSSPPSSDSPTQQPVESAFQEQKSQTSPGYAAPPLSPPHSENDENAALIAALQPEDHGKATAMGLFNKPRTPFDEEQFTRRQLQMHQGRNTPPLSRPSPVASGRGTPQDLPGRPRGPSTTSYRSRGGSVSSHYSETQRPGTGTSVGASSARGMNGTFFDTTPSESEDEGDYAFVHPALRSKTPSKPSTPTGEEPSPLSPLPEVRYSDLGDLKPIAEQDVVESTPDREEALPEKPDSPTLGPSGLGLSGLVRTHLRRGSDRSSIFPPPSPGLPPNTADDDGGREPSVAESEAKDTSPQPSAMSKSVDLKQALNGSSWQGQIVAQHRRGGSTETQREREEFENELAERRRKVQEKLKGFAESESRSASPVSGRHTPDYPPARPGNAFALLKSRSGKHHLFNRQQDSKNPRGYGIGNASTPALVPDDSWEEERPSFLGKHSNSSSPHVGERSMRSRMAAFGRTSQEDSRESSRSRGASPHASFGSRRERSSSDASGRSKSRNRHNREDLETLEEDTVGPYGRRGYPEIDTHGMNSVASSARPSVEVSDSPYDRSSSAASGRMRSGSRSGVHDRPLQLPPTTNSPMVGAPRPSPIAPYSANATPPLYDLPSEHGATPAPTYPSTIPQRAPGHGALQKRVIDKTQISEPTFVSCTSNVPTVGLPPGASLSNGMETPPVPPMNPRRRRQTTTQTILGAIKGEKPDTPPTATWGPDEHSTFSDEGERRPKSRHRLRKTSSEGGNLSAKARQQAMSAAPPPAMPAYPPPQESMQKKRSASFCTADLPAVITAFDDFFHIERTNLASLPRASFSYPGSPVGAMKVMALLQVDGAADRRRIAKKKKNAQKKKNKGKKRVTAQVDSKTADEGSEGIRKGNGNEVEVEIEKDNIPADGVDDKVEQTEANDSNGRPFSPMIMDSSRSSTMQPDDTPTGPSEPIHSSDSTRDDHATKDTIHEAHNDNAAASGAAVARSGSTLCRVHGRLCVFHPACCVHKPRPADCTCPAKASCCCLHHAGDCCHCAYAVVAAVAAGNFAVVASGGNASAGPAGNMQRHDKVHGEEENAGDRNDAHAPECGRCDNDREEKTTEPEKKAPGADNGPADKDGIDTLSPIAQHLLRCFERTGHYDLLITLRSSTELFWPVTFRAHTAIVSRSPLVTKFLRTTTDKTKDGEPRELLAVAGANFCLPKPFQHVIQYMYGAPLLTATQLRAQTLAEFGYTEDTHQLTQFCLEAAMTDAAVCYAAAGAFFQLRDVVERGVQLAVDTISLANIEVAFWLSLNMAKVAVRMDLTTCADDNTTTTVTTASKKKKKNEAKGAVQWHGDAHDPVKELKDAAVSRLATAALRFVMNGISETFMLDVKAHCAGMPDRIPDHLRGRHTATAAETYRGPAYSEPMAPGEKLSAVLLALTFNHLRVLFVGMGVKRAMTAELAEKIVCERERRRITALQELAKQPGAQLEKDAASEEVLELGFREFYISKAQVDAEKPGEMVTEIALDREWTGLNPFRRPSPLTRLQVSC